MVEKVQGTIDWAKAKLEAYPKAKKELSPLLLALSRTHCITILHSSPHLSHRPQNLSRRLLAVLASSWVAFSTCSTTSWAASGSGGFYPGSSPPQVCSRFTKGWVLISGLTLVLAGTRWSSILLSAADCIIVLLVYRDHVYSA